MRGGDDGIGPGSEGVHGQARRSTEAQVRTPRLVDDERDAAAVGHPRPAGEGRSRPRRTTARRPATQLGVRVLVQGHGERAGAMPVPTPQPASCSGPTHTGWRPSSMSARVRRDVGVAGADDGVSGAQGREQQGVVSARRPVDQHERAVGAPERGDAAFGLAARGVVRRRVEPESLVNGPSPSRSSRAGSAPAPPLWPGQEKATVPRPTWARNASTRGVAERGARGRGTVELGVPVSSA